MANVRGEEGAVHFDNGSGSVSAVVGTTAWTLDMTKDTLECTAHGDTARKYVGSLKSATGTVEVQYTETSGDAVAELLADVNTSEDPADASFNLFLNESGAKKYSFNGIVTGVGAASTVGELTTQTVNFQVSGPITFAI
jgi:hypothetical protein|tara:strand:+ start:1538 stop:1954 length:417 start_codon:yes stop_codon:yes gene_type:complete